MKITRRLLLVTVIAALILTACDKDGEPEATFTSVALPASPTDTPSAPPASDPPTATPAESGTSGEQTGGTAGGGFLDLSSLKTDPQALSSSPFPSYRLDVEWSVEPKQGSDTPAASSRLEVLHNSDPLAEQMTVVDATSGDTTKMIHIGNQLWINSGDEWFEVTSDDLNTFDQLFLSFSSATAGLGGDAEFVGNEDLGVPTKHYRFNKPLLGVAVGAYNNIEGHVWVTGDEKTVVKYLYTADDDKANYRWSWLLSGFGETHDIQPPADAPGQSEDFPVMADATDKVAFGGTISYQTPSNMDQVVEFYKENLPAQGWVFDEANSSISAQLSALFFKKGDGTAQVTVTPGADGGSQVFVNSGP